MDRKNRNEGAFAKTFLFAKAPRCFLLTLLALSRKSLRNVSLDLVGDSAMKNDGPFPNKESTNVLKNFRQSLGSEKNGVIMKRVFSLELSSRISKPPNSLENGRVLPSKISRISKFSREWTF